MKGNLLIDLVPSSTLTGISSGSLHDAMLTSSATRQAAAHSRREIFTNLSPDKASFLL